MTSSNRLSLSRPLAETETPVVEVVATTRREEARSAMAVVAALRDRGVPVRDIAVVVRDLDAYEPPFFRAAVQYGMAPVFWTQLYVTRTRPYALVESVCDALDAEELDSDTLLRPLEHRWAPVEATTDEWPVEPAALDRVRRALPGGSRTLEEWTEALEASDADPRVLTFADWLGTAPDPSPETVRSVLSDVVEGYAEHGLPVTKEADSPALLDTETDARAVVRVRTLVRQLRHKFDDRLDEGAVERSWGDVAELANVIATQRPGRREHSNARALDVLEANDVWALDVPFVVAVGLTADDWHRVTDSMVPPEFQETVLRGDGDVGKLAPRPSWVNGRDRDQFLDTLGAAGEAVIVTRHTQTVDGNEVYPSPFLDRIDARRINESDRQRLVSEERELPPEIRRLLPPQAEVSDGE
ncbi:hypothetical protein [Haloferax volcanii]|uniref:ATP-dependent helicase/nuclease subunit B n=2 Tax=Haloferax volcanii TaxID=2246 RepID=D4GX78_HALVD|nr:hypothetical protein [Haloferax volcanii]ADE03020.1 uncharacterized protein HVO_2826 [Haloferax volcanii DS2]MBS8121210.1 hypothetical protein [Haloferax volcanii]MBS8126219.1 hypothetical protein [Haloferax volcanii]MBS8130089.1 hypothetical protein [Haloferax volcanii]MBS8133954.1 hypothetical protein [Haloferax volcanii]